MYAFQEENVENISLQSPKILVYNLSSERKPDDLFSVECKKIKQQS